MAGIIGGMSATDIEKRLLAIEQELARLKNGGVDAMTSHPIKALEKIHGVFEADDAFQEATRLGRRWRKAQQFAAAKRKAKPR
jgi:hypothetical protein